MWKWGLRDVVVRCHVGNLRISGVMARKTIAEAARRWHLPLDSSASRIWGEYMAGTVMLSSFYKAEERVKLMVQSPAIQEIYAEAMAAGEVRGKAVFADENNPQLHEPGHMLVSKILYGATKPYDTTIAATGIPEVDWQTFYDVSEQVPTVVRISSEMTDEHARCCGITIQKMPEAAPNERHYELEELQFEHFPLAAEDLINNSDLVQYLNRLIPHADITEKTCRKIPLDFFCRCSKKSFASRLTELKKSDLEQAVRDSGEEGIDLTCHFCNESYHFPQGELESLLRSIA